MDEGVEVRMIPHLPKMKPLRKNDMIRMVAANAIIAIFMLGIGNWFVGMFLLFDSETVGIVVGFLFALGLVLLIVGLGSYLLWIYDQISEALDNADRQG